MKNEHHYARVWVNSPDLYEVSENEIQINI